jgi:cell division protein FtsA
MAEAERLKRNFGCALGRMVADDEEIEVPGRGRPHAAERFRRVLSDIIEPRVEEIFAVVRKRIEDTGLLEQLSAGVVLTGGAVLMEGMTEFAEEILGMPVRLGVPVGVRGITQLVAGAAVRDRRRPGAVRSERAAPARDRDRRSTSRRQRVSRRSSARRGTRRERRMKRASNESRRNGRFWNWLRAAF